jgi:CBS domain-containing protein
LSPSFPPGTSREAAMALLADSKKGMLPLVNADNEVVGLATR